MAAILSQLQCVNRVPPLCISLPPCNHLPCYIYPTLPMGVMNRENTICRTQYRLSAERKHSWYALFEKPSCQPFAPKNKQPYFVTHLICKLSWHIILVIITFYLCFYDPHMIGTLLNMIKNNIQNVWYIKGLYIRKLLLIVVWSDKMTLFQIRIIRIKSWPFGVVIC